MADASGDAKPTPSAAQTASSDLRPATDETKLVTNPICDDSKEAPATDEKSTTVTETASAAAANVANTATAAATGVKDQVFSMFGGGAKKEKKEEEDDKDEPSGSSKVKKDADDDVSFRHAIAWYTTDLPPTGQG
jgi:Ran-binding protein 1